MPLLIRFFISYYNLVSVSEPSLFVSLLQILCIFLARFFSLLLLNVYSVFILDHEIYGQNV